MAADIAISVEGLSKRYLIGHRHAATETFREMLGRRARGIGRSLADLGRGRQPIGDDTVEEFWALRDVSFEVPRGEVLGVIGRNGAGKSTLLKVLSRITEPTEGRAVIRGRVSSLLEVGTGFHPELTGRENIFLNGAILGMTRAEIVARFDEIVAFAEVERFLDTPVKRYSSGMYVRLAFAVAAHLEPEILIIDEVLAVGDVVFQKKCLGKMRDVAQHGRTVLFVSHNMQTVAGLTESAVMLENGAAVAHGPSREIIGRYLAVGSELNTSYRADPKEGQPSITRVELKTSGPGPVQQHGRPMSVEIDIDTPESVPNAAVSFQILTPACQPVLHVLNLNSEISILQKPGRHKLICTFPRIRLYPGNYLMDIHFGASEPRRVFEAPKRICPFEVAMIDEVREFYWAPNNALYVEDVYWKAE
jgi:lipopolysaccharide transport system ATP-binding protein